MKKIITGVVVILIIAGACAPFVNGLVMEKIVTQTKNDLNTMYAATGSSVTIDILEYDRGFASSEIEWKIQLGSLAVLYGVDEIILIDHAKHGFTGVVSKTSFEKNPWFIELLNDKFGGENPFNISTTYKMFGKIESIIDINAFSLQVENETVDFRPAKIVTECDEELTHFISEATWEGLSVSDTVKVDTVSLVYDLQKISTYIWDGEITYGINKITIEDQREKFEFTNFKGDYTLDFNREKNILSTGGAIQIDNLLAGNEQVKDMFVRLNVQNIDAQGYEEFMEIYTRTVNSTLNDISTAQEDPEKILEEEMATAGMQMMAAYEKFLKKGLKINISDLHAQLPMGKVTGNLELELNKDITLVQLAPIAMQPNLAFDIISLQSDFSFPAVLAADRQPMLVSPVYPGMQTGLFVKDGENLVHKAQTKDGKLFLNGHEVVLN